MGDPAALRFAQRLLALEQSLKDQTEAAGSLGEQLKRLQFEAKVVADEAKALKVAPARSAPEAAADEAKACKVAPARSAPEAPRLTPRPILPSLDTDLKPATVWMPEELEAVELAHVELTHVSKEEELSSPIPIQESEAQRSDGSLTSSSCPLACRGEENARRSASLVSNASPSPRPRRRSLNSLFSSQQQPHKPRERMRLFVDPETITSNLREYFSETRNSIYRQTGFAAWLCKSAAFESFAFLLICLNTVWIGVETDLNPSPVLFDAAPVFQVLGHTFCVLFLVEFSVRFCALKRKIYLFREPWLMFDSVLVTLIVFETWVLNLVVVLWGTAVSTNFKMLIAFRALRLMRVLRLARILQGLPELMVIVRAIGIALRAIFIVLVLLGLIVYVGSIVFRVLLEDTDLGKQRFSSIPVAMSTLLLDVTLSGTRGVPVIQLARDEHVVYGLALLVFTLLANVTVMGVLGGLLVQTVKTVAEVEKEEHQIRRMAQTMDKLWEVMGKDDPYSESTIEPDELRMYLAKSGAHEVFEEVGVDLEGLGFVSRFFFDQYDGRLTKPQLTRIVLDLRGKNGAKVKDHVETRRFMDILFKQYGNVRPQERMSTATAECYKSSKYSATSSRPL